MAIAHTARTRDGPSQHRQSDFGGSTKGRASCHPGITARCCATQAWEPAHSLPFEYKLTRVDCEKESECARVASATHCGSRLEVVSCDGCTIVCARFLGSGLGSVER